MSKRRIDDVAMPQYNQGECAKLVTRLTNIPFDVVSEVLRVWNNSVMIGSEDPNEVVELKFDDAIEMLCQFLAGTVDAEVCVAVIDGELAYLGELGLVNRVKCGRYDGM